MSKVKVRIAVVVDAKGEWNSCGASAFKNNDEEAMDLAVEGVEPGERRYWLEAELEMPTPPTVVEATIKEDLNDV